MKKNKNLKYFLISALILFILSLFFSIKVILPQLDKGIMSLFTIITNIYIPILTAIITFGGVAFSIFENNKNNHINNLKEIEARKEADTLQKELLRKEILGKAKLQHLNDLKNHYHEYLLQASHLRTLFLMPNNVRSLSAQAEPNFVTIQRETQTCIQKFVAQSDILISSLHIIGKEMTLDTVNFIQIFKETADLTSVKISEKVSIAYENPRQDGIIDYHVLENEKKILEDFDIQLSNIKTLVHLVFDKTSREINYLLVDLDLTP